MLKAVPKAKKLQKMTRIPLYFCRRKGLPFTVSHVSLQHLLCLHELEKVNQLNVCLCFVFRKLEKEWLSLDFIQNNPLSLVSNLLLHGRNEFEFYYCTNLLLVVITR